MNWDRPRLLTPNDREHTNNKSTTVGMPVFHVGSAWEVPAVKCLVGSNVQ